MTNFEELIQNLKDIGDLLLNLDYTKDFKSLMADIEEIDHEIWLIKMKLYMLDK